jgi:hypothetical protein
LTDGQTDYLLYTSDDPDYGLAYYEFDDITESPTDSSFFSLHWQGNFALDSLGGKYLVSIYENRVHITVKDVVTTAPSFDEELPLRSSLHQNYPNPFNPLTTLQFTIADRQSTILSVYNLLGQEVTTLVNEVKSPGTYTVSWDATGQPSGVYFYRLTAGSLVATRKLVLSK